ncbi:hypothetical protein MRX96_002263 [Rhipicephalus microplus]
MNAAVTSNTAKDMELQSQQRWMTEWSAYISNLHRNPRTMCLVPTSHQIRCQLATTQSRLRSAPNRIAAGIKGVPLVSVSRRLNVNARPQGNLRCGRVRPVAAFCAKVKVVLSRANRNNRITTMPPTSLPLLPVPPLADREDLDDKLTLHERGCLPLETSPAVQDRSTCPFRFLTSFDRRRLPRLVTTVRCMCPGSTCSKRRGYRCLEVNRPMTVMRRVGRVYVDKVEDMPVACVCAYVGRKSRGRRP